MKSKVKLLENLHGMKQSDLAQEIGRCPADIYRYANGKTYPGVITAIKIARALNVSVEDIWGDCVDTAQD